MDTFDKVMVTLSGFGAALVALWPTGEEPVHDHERLR